jgi:2-polyprenyl-6-methoxyphenol hydroxylase-like FAD-dependent oxidoreductase
MARLDADVVIVGAGVAGLAVAAGLARAQVRVLLVDARAHTAPTFKAEKLLEPQAALLERLGLLAAVTPACAPIASIVLAQGGLRLATAPVRQWGFLYHDLVNRLRGALPETVARRQAHVEDVQLGDELQELQLDSGESLRTRLVVLATGLSPRLLTRLGLARRMVSARHSLTAGVTVARQGGGDFDFDAAMLYPAGIGRSACTSMFRTREGMRVNVCTYQDAESAWARRFRRDPIGAMEEAIPGTRRVAGALVATSRPVLGASHLWTVDAPARPGLVLVGDAFQSTCPATASGLGKALTDADVLVHECVPAWLATPGLGIEKVKRYYQDARKLAADRESLETATYFRRMTFEARRTLMRRRLRTFLGLRVRQWMRARR